MKNLNIFKTLAVGLLIFPAFSSAMEPTDGRAIREAALNKKREDTKNNQPIKTSSPTPKKKNKTIPLSACYVELPMDKIEYYTGNNIKFYNEYKAREENNNQASTPVNTGSNIKVSPSVSFPINKCDPLLLESAGSIRWFFSSAVEGSVPRFGEPITVTNPSITHVYAVRGKANSNGYWVQVYFGIDANNPKFANANKKVYQGTILYLLTKDTAHVENNSSYYSDDAKYLSNTEIGQEAKKQLSAMNIESSRGWKDPVFLQMVKDLFTQKDGSCLSQNQMLLSSVCYWTKEENKLKGIKYGNK